VPATTPSPSAASDSTCPTGSFTHGRTPPRSVQRSMRPLSQASATEPSLSTTSAQIVVTLSSGVVDTLGPSSSEPSARTTTPCDSALA
jgi:hypothetical protein